MDLKRSIFDRSHDVKLSCDMGQLIPMFIDDVLPGDVYRVKTDSLLRLAPMLAPMMHKVNLYTHYFFVPNRLLWTNWEKFITGGEDGDDTTVAPYIDSPAQGGWSISSLADYFNIPPELPSIRVSALPFRAYGLIYNEWYRNQNLIDKVTVSTADGADITTNTDLLYRCWEKDYFTQCLPWTQRGDEVEINLGGTSDVSLKGTAPYTEQKGLNRTTGAAMNAAAFMTSAAGIVEDAVGTDMVLDPNGSLEVDLSEANPIGINTLRLAFQLQKWAEKQARGGARYIETILSHFGIRSPDARLQRPEFLGGGKASVIVSEVLQTSETDTTPQGNMAGHGFSAAGGHGFSKAFTEHGWIIGLLSIMPRTGYSQGIPRMYSRDDRFDYGWPALAHIGEQAVLNKEIYRNQGSPDGVFGYTPRYEEYRKKPSSIHGTFRDSMNYWHMAREFSGAPALDDTFVTADPTKRIFAAEDEAGCWVQMAHQVECARLLPKKGIPGYIDH